MCVLSLPKMLILWVTFLLGTGLENIVDGRLLTECSTTLLPLSVIILFFKHPLPLSIPLSRSSWGSSCFLYCNISKGWLAANTSDVVCTCPILWPTHILSHTLTVYTSPHSTPTRPVEISFSPHHGCTAVCMFVSSSHTSCTVEYFMLSLAARLTLYSLSS